MHAAILTFMTQSEPMNMEYYFETLFSSFLFPPPEKPVPQSFMQTTLSNTGQVHSPANWLRLVHQGDPDHHYIVTTLSHYKEQSLFPNFQHEYIVLYIQLRAQQPPPIITAIRVSRTIANHTPTARLGLWGSAEDTVTILGDITQVQIPDKRVLHLTWTPDQAPDLEHLSVLICQIHNSSPRYRLFKTCCYSFARTISDSARATLNSTEHIHQTRFFTRRSHFMHFIPAGIMRAQISTDVIVAMTQDVPGKHFFKSAIDLLFMIYPDDDIEYET